jgi:hypothetical protein
MTKSDIEFRASWPAERVGSVQSHGIFCYGTDGAVAGKFRFPVKLLRDGGIGMAIADKGAKMRRVRIRFLRFWQFCPAIECTDAFARYLQSEYYRVS